jgi:transcription-repair coupling factor (superfamily II helicase)
LLTPAREFIIPPGQLSAQDQIEKSEFYLPLFHTVPASLLDYIPRNALLVIDDVQTLKDTVLEIEEQAVAIREGDIREGILDPDFPVPYLSWSEIFDSLSSHRYLVLGPGFIDEDEPQDWSQGLRLDSLSNRFNAGPRFAGHLKQLMEHINQLVSSGGKVVVVSRQIARLKELWDEQSVQTTQNQPAFLEGSLTEGFEFETPDCPRLHLLSDGEIFGWRRPEPRKRVRLISEAPEAGYADLEIDGYVVHVDHGIGRFKGIVRRAVEGTEREYLCVEYADEAQLFVPVHQADRLTRYVGPDNRTPTISRLGGAEWRNLKSSVKEAVKEVAEELLDLYAKRNIVEGYSFSLDTTWQGELEASFPYIETDDQKRVLVEVKRDMENSRPMDRLICGDVGYGKTEIALRAAFKAVMDGKQVAFSSLPTVLAQQHFHTFQQSVSRLSVQVEMLSRFRNQQQQSEIIHLLGKEN